MVLFNEKVLLNKIKEECVRIGIKFIDLTYYRSIQKLSGKNGESLKITIPKGNIHIEDFLKSGKYYNDIIYSKMQVVVSNHYNDKLIGIDKKIHGRNHESFILFLKDSHCMVKDHPNGDKEIGELVLVGDWKINFSEENMLPSTQGTEVGLIFKEKK